MSLSNEDARKIEQFALKYYRSLDKLHNESHARRTVKLAEFIARNEGGNLQLVKLGALLHQFHDHEEILAGFLKKLGMSQ
ncbi:hypothetical protein COT48_05895 [Candidatus Woesearchaeota archaeon CG08_land_8_20_14_0_20_47_9]|nr:MAG: hypothetical protein COT48_05895 [Candidatus Woesearchaeota archaeon CG08_land_8_20_14_0_20_47_9]HII29596.1 hypothetical protein [Candidatus Woesearchaeota archaeon]